MAKCSGWRWVRRRWRSLRPRSVVSLRQSRKRRLIAGSATVGAAANLWAPRGYRPSAGMSRGTCAATGTPASEDAEPGTDAEGVAGRTESAGPSPNTGHSADLAGGAGSPPPPGIAGSPNHYDRHDHGTRLRPFDPERDAAVRRALEATRDFLVGLPHLDQAQERLLRHCARLLAETTREFGLPEGLITTARYNVRLSKPAPPNQPCSEPIRYRSWRPTKGPAPRDAPSRTSRSRCASAVRSPPRSTPERGSLPPSQVRPLPVERGAWFQLGLAAGSVSSSQPAPRPQEPPTDGLGNPQPGSWRRLHPWPGGQAPGCRNPLPVRS